MDYENIKKLMEEHLEQLEYISFLQKLWVSLYFRANVRMQIVVSKKYYFYGTEKDSSMNLVVSRIAVLKIKYFYGTEKDFFKKKQVSRIMVYKKILFVGIEKDFSRENSEMTL